MDHYDNVAAEYARTDSGAELVIRELLSSDLEEKNPNVTLDLGCGTGRYLSLSRGREIIGIDLSRNMLKQAKKYGGHLVHGDIHHLPFRRSTFDLVYSISVLGEIQPVSDTILDEILGVGQESCFFIFTVVPPSRFRAMKKLLFHLSLITTVTIFSPFSESEESVMNRVRGRGFHLLDSQYVQGRVSHYYFRTISKLRAKLRRRKSGEL